MSKFHDRFVERALLAIAILAGGLCFRSVAWGTVARPCFNNNCMLILYWYDCGLLNGGSWQTSDCLYCWNNGRCMQGGNPPCVCEKVGATRVCNTADSPPPP